MAIKLNIGDPKSKKTLQVELDDQNSKALHGKKLGETFKGETVDKPGYEFEITGGSDKAGIPMRRDVDGDRRRKVLIMKSVGNRKNRNGIRLRRTVAGNTVGTETVQLNVKVTKTGKASLFEEKKEEAPAEEKTEAKPEAPAKKKAEEKPAEKPAEEKPKAKKEEKPEAPAEEKKE